jgi:hypothetical protein
MLARSTLIIAVLVLGLMPARAIATPQDIASTHAYILANFALARETEAGVKATQASIVRLNQRLGQECRDVGAGSPENEESQKTSYEVVGALWSVSYGADAGPIGAFAQAVRPLRWSNPRLTRLAQSYARSLHELAALPMPNLCGDVRAWSASGFRTIPATTLGFDKRAESIETHTIPPRLLAPYERPADKSILARTTRLETKLEHTETVVGFNDWDSLLETLGLNQ